jgi:hypothetical protein
MFLRQRQLLQVGPHNLGNTHHIVNHNLIKEPYLACYSRDLVQKRIEQHQSILDIVNALLGENKLKDSHYVRLNASHRLWVDGRLNDTGDSFEATSRS